MLAELGEGILDSTIIVCTADHGDFAGEHGLIWKNLGFYEAVHRIPLLIRYPGSVPSGLKFDGFVENIDIMPSLCGMVGCVTPPGIDGRSFASSLTGQGTWTKRVAMGDHVKDYYHMSLRTEDFRLRGPERGRIRAVRSPYRSQRAHQPMA